MTAVVVALFACSLRGIAAGSTNNPSSVQMNFVADATLSADEVKAIVKLAESCGIGKVTEVKTFHHLPSSIRGILVTSDKKVDGRKVTFQTLEVFREGWARETKPTSPAQAKSVGAFWVPGMAWPQTHELMSFATAKGTILVNMDAEIPIDVADRIVRAFATGRIRYANDVLPRLMRAEDFSRPEWLSKSSKGDRFWISFSGRLDRYEFTLSGSDVEVLRVVHVFI